jgi:hypothetical protein
MPAAPRPVSLPGVELALLTALLLAQLLLIGA